MQIYNSNQERCTDAAAGAVPELAGELELNVDNTNADLGKPAATYASALEIPCTVKISEEKKELLSRKNKTKAARPTGSWVLKE